MDVRRSVEAPIWMRGRRSHVRLLIYTTSKGEHHAIKTAAVCHTKERETLDPLYYGIKLHGRGRDKTH